jgi:hypothetical protein
MLGYEGLALSAGTADDLRRIPLAGKACCIHRRFEAWL